MKKKTIMIASILAVGAIGTAGYSASATYEESKANVEQEDVIRIIEDKFDGNVKEIEFEKDDGKEKYEVEYTKGNKEYEVEIDANDGKVIKEEVEVASQHHGIHKDDNREQVKPKHNNSGEKAKAKNDDDRKQAKLKNDNTNKSKGNGLISMQEAIAIAKQNYSGKVTEVELDDDDGHRIYEIEIETNRGEVELEIDAKTGKILDVEWDD